MESRSSSPLARFRRTAAFIAILAFAFALSPDVLFGQAVHEGKWKLTSSEDFTIVYANLSSTSQKVVLTVCPTSGGNISVNAAGIVTFLQPPNCLTASYTLNASDQVVIRPTSGNGGSGTYAVSVVP